MGRKYIANFTGALTTAIEVIRISSAATNVTKIIGIRIEQSTDYGDAAAEGLHWQLYRATGGSAGTTITPRPVSAGDTAFLGVVSHTPGASTPGVTLLEAGMNIQAGWLWTPTEKMEIEIAPSAIVILKLNSAPSPDGITFQIDIDLEELG